MDEPTNDLDLETQELLEELLLDYPGTLILVSHDRAFLNNVVTSTIVFEGKGEVYSYPGGYDDWLAQHTVSAAKEKEHAPAPKAVAAVQPPSAKPRKLSFKEQAELKQLPETIAALEAEQEELTNLLSDTELYKNDPKKIAAAQARIITIMDELLKSYERWEYLENCQKG